MPDRILRNFFLVSLLVAGCSDRITTSKPNSIVPHADSGSLSVDPKIHRLGQIPGGIDKTIQVETKLTNSGKNRLQIHDIVASCDCTKASLNKKVLEPGESAILITDLKLGESQDLRSSRVMVRSSDSENPLAQIAFEWQTLNPISTPEPSLAYLDLPMRDPEVAKIPIKSSSIAICVNCKFDVEVDPNLLHCDWVPNTKAIRSDHGFDQQHPGEVSFGDLRLRLMPQSDNQQYLRTIKLTLTCKDETRARLAIPVRWSFSQPVSWTPTRIFLGSRSPGERVEKELFVKSSTNDKIRLISISCTDAAMRIDSELPLNPISHEFVSFTLTIPSKPGPWTETLILKTDRTEAGEIRIPVSCIIEEKRAR